MTELFTVAQQGTPRGTAGHTSYCYLTLAETLSQQWERTCVRVDWNGRDAELHTEGKTEYIEMNDL